MSSAPDDSELKLRYQSVFYVSRDQILDLLFNHKIFYQLSYLKPTNVLHFSHVVLISAKNDNKSMIKGKEIPNREKEKEKNLERALWKW